MRIVVLSTPDWEVLSRSNRFCLTGGSLSYLALAISEKKESIDLVSLNDANLIVSGSPAALEDLLDLSEGKYTLFAVHGSEPFADPLREGSDVLDKIKRKRGRKFTH